MTMDYRSPKKEFGQTTEQAFFSSEGRRLEEGLRLLHEGDDSIQAKNLTAGLPGDVRATIHVHPGIYSAIGDLEEASLAASEQAFLNSLARRNYANLTKKRDEIKDSERIAETLIKDYYLGTIEQNSLLGQALQPTFKKKTN